MKIATKKRVAAFKRSCTQTGGGQPDPRLTLTPAEERVAALIGPVSVSGISGGGGAQRNLPPCLIQMTIHHQAPVACRQRLPSLMLGQRHRAPKEVGLHHPVLQNPRTRGF